MTVSYPNESTAYRHARAKLLEAEIALRAQIEDVATLRRALPKGGQPPSDYAFQDTNGSDAPLSSLFGEHDTLAIYSLMYREDAEHPCPICSAFLDGLNGQLKHLARRLSLVVVAQSSPSRLAALQKQMGWT
ncbi:MAG: DUF899 domain-containing protein [Rhodobacteraceae bacterium]|nr:DUF899 domain-containing protein [Paracoccaceae bacterium]